MTGLVSVVIPAYNCEAWVAEAIDSALAQDHAAVEIIVVNDGSRDGTLGVLQGYGDRIRVIDQSNAGPPAARNAGLAAARGEFVAFLDADDVWWPQKLSDQVAFLEAHPEVGTIVSSWQVWEPGADGRFVRPAAPPLRAAAEVPQALWCGWRYNELLFDCELLTTCVMLRARTVREVGAFDTGLWNGDDYDYWLRATRVAPVAKLARPGALYRALPGSVSRKPRAVNAELDVLRMALARWGRTGPDGRETPERDLQERVDSLVLAHGWLHLERGDAAIAFDAFRELLRRHPARAGLWVNTLKAAAKRATAARATARP
jgi:glycosyltransferase involved in cell wall biosynthesis